MAMIPQPLTFPLPKPWVGQQFHRDEIGAINFLVGPNGSGKSRFANALKNHLPRSRMLGTDRLQGMGISPLDFLGDSFTQGYQKSWFGNFKGAGANFGSGIDSFVILEERPDIRIMVEATLTNLFNRNITIEWDSGNLVPKATSGRTGEAYRIDRDECHGIKELLVLLTHLYSDEYDYLIVDEPELNLHPQFQSFFMQEVRKIAGAPDRGSRKKCIFLITHSPFIIDLRSMDDLSSVISFSSDHSIPVSIAATTSPGSRLVSLIPRLNVHHKQLFFSDDPIFVEGILDAQIIEAIQERRGVSITAAGSCIIDVGGCEEVNKYLEFCRAFGKSAYFLYDLDSLFSGNLRQCIKADGEVSNFLATLGLGSDFGRYCGELDRKLTDAVKLVQTDTTRPSAILPLKEYVENLSPDGELNNKSLARARIAILNEIAFRRAGIVSVISEKLAADIEGRLARICEVLGTKKVFLLPGGALEHYLPSFDGNPYSLDDAAKRRSVETEVALLSQGGLDSELPNRYGALFDNIANLPAKPPVDTDAVLLRYLGDYVHQFQGLVLTNHDWGLEQLKRQLSLITAGLGKLFEIEKFERPEERQFLARIRIHEPSRRFVDVSHDTNAGMRCFELKTDQHS